MKRSRNECAASSDFDLALIRTDAGSLSLPMQYRQLGQADAVPAALTRRLPEWNSIIVALGRSISSGDVADLNSAAGAGSYRPPSSGSAFNKFDEPTKEYAKALAEVGKLVRCTDAEAAGLSRLLKYGLPREGTIVSEENSMVAIGEAAASVMIHLQDCARGACHQASIGANAHAHAVSIDHLPFGTRNWVVGGESELCVHDGMVLGSLDEFPNRSREISSDEEDLSTFLCARAYALTLQKSYAASVIPNDITKMLMYGPWVSLLRQSVSLGAGSHLGTKAMVEAVISADLVARQPAHGITPSQHAGAVDICSALEKEDWGKLVFLLHINSINRTYYYQSLQLYRGLLIGVATTLARGIAGDEAAKLFALRSHLATLVDVMVGKATLFDQALSTFAKDGDAADVVLFGALYEEAIGSILAAGCVLKGRGTGKDHFCSDLWARIAGRTGVSLTAPHKRRKGSSGAAHLNREEGLAPCADGALVGPRFRTNLVADIRDTSHTAVMLAEHELLLRSLEDAQKDIAARENREFALWNAIGILQPRATEVDQYVTEMLAGVARAGMGEASRMPMLESSYVDSRRRFGDAVHEHNSRFGHYVNLS